MVESGIKHHKPNQTKAYYAIILDSVMYIYILKMYKRNMELDLTLKLHTCRLNYNIIACWCPIAWCQAFFFRVRVILKMHRGNMELDPTLKLHTCRLNYNMIACWCPVVWCQGLELILRKFQILGLLSFIFLERCYITIFYSNYILKFLKKEFYFKDQIHLLYNTVLFSSLKLLHWILYFLINVYTTVLLFSFEVP